MISLLRQRRKGSGSPVLRRAEPRLDPRLRMIPLRIGNAWLYRHYHHYPLRQVDPRARRERQRIGIPIVCVGVVEVGYDLIVDVESQMTAESALL